MRIIDLDRNISIVILNTLIIHKNRLKKVPIFKKTFCSKNYGKMELILIGVFSKT